MKGAFQLLLPLLAGFALAMLTLQLGNWQLRRAAEKAALQRVAAERAAAGARALPATATVEEWQRVRITGRWLAQATVYLDNRSYKGRPGFHVLTPVELADGSGSVLVNRGWVAAGIDRRQLPAVPPAGEDAELEGVVRLPQHSPFTLADSPGQGRLWQYLDLAHYRAQTGVAVAEWIVQQASPSADGLVRDWPQPDAGIERHRGYALQWYGLAALAAGLTLRYGWRIFRGRHRDGHAARV